MHFYKLYAFSKIISRAHVQLQYRTGIYWGKILYTHTNKGCNALRVVWSKQPTIK